MIAYFVYHILNGDRGIFALNKLKSDLEEKKAILATLEAKKKDLSKKAYLMRPDSLDLDYLEEQARKILGFGYPGEIIIYDKK